jgi:carbon-monoxide dehydrogenase small subunit
VETIKFEVNGKKWRSSVSWTSLLFTLRERLLLYGSKACEQGECGSCSVFLDGQLVCACMVPACTASASKVTTIEGVRHDELFKGAGEPPIVSSGPAIMNALCAATGRKLVRIPVTRDDLCLASPPTRVEPR